MHTLALLLAQEEDGGNALIDVVPGLMIWTIVTFLIVLFVLRRLAFGRIQGLIDARRDRIREALDEADKARQEARELRELTKAEREEAKGEREQILEETRRQAQSLFEQARTLLAAEKVTGKTLDADDQRRLIDETIQEVDVKELVSEN